jgi:predicted nucleic acid-binding protein
MVYAVVDTNVLVSAALAKNRSESIPLKIFLGIAQKKYIPIIDSNIIEEYREVLQRGKFNFSLEYQNSFIDEISKYAVNEPVKESNVVLPDMDDKIFYDVAFAHQDKKAFLVTGNLKHFPGCPFAISPKDFYELMRPTPSGFVINESRIDYDVSRLMQALYTLNDEAHKNGTAVMSEEEIEAEIKAVRHSRASGL